MMAYIENMYVTVGKKLQDWSQTDSMFLMSGHRTQLKLIRNIIHKYETKCFLNYNVSPYFYIKIPRTPITLCRAYGSSSNSHCGRISWLPPAPFPIMPRDHSVQACPSLRSMSGGSKALPEWILGPCVLEMWDWSLDGYGQAL